MINEGANQGKDLRGRVVSMTIPAYSSKLQ